MSALYRGLRKRYNTHDNNRTYSKKEIVLYCTLGFQDGDGILARQSVAIIANTAVSFRSTIPPLHGPIVEFMQLDKALSSEHFVTNFPIAMTSIDSMLNSRKKSRFRRASFIISAQRNLVFFLLFYCSICFDESASNRKTFPFFAHAATIRVPTSKSEELKSKERSPESVDVEKAAKNATKSLSLNQILVKAGKRGLGGGISGALAGAVQVLALMWLRTITNYQCRYGGTFRQAFQTLMKQGGIKRLYEGLAFALIQAPIIRFVSTAANDSVESFLSNFKPTQSWGPERTTIFASVVVGFARILLMPIDTLKTVLQVDSKEGFKNLMRRLKVGKFMILYEGAAAVAIMGVVGVSEA